MTAQTAFILARYIWIPNAVFGLKVRILNLFNRY